MLFETIFFGTFLIIGYIVMCMVAGFIFMVIYEILSILIEESYNVVYESVALVIRFLVRRENVPLEEN